MKKFTFQSVFMVSIIFCIVAVVATLIVGLQNFILDQTNSLYMSRCSKKYYKQLLTYANYIIIFLSLCIPTLCQILIVLLHIKNLSSERFSDKVYAIPIMISFLFQGVAGGKALKTSSSLLQCGENADFLSLCLILILLSLIFIIIQMVVLGVYFCTTVSGKLSFSATNQSNFSKFPLNQKMENDIDFGSLPMSMRRKRKNRTSDNHRTKFQFETQSKAIQSKIQEKQQKDQMKMFYEKKNEIVSDGSLSMMPTQPKGFNYDLKKQKLMVELESQSQTNKGSNEEEMNFRELNKSEKIELESQIVNFSQMQFKQTDRPHQKKTKIFSRVLK